MVFSIIISNNFCEVLGGRRGAKKQDTEFIGSGLGLPYSRDSKSPPSQQWLFLASDRGWSINEPGGRREEDIHFVLTTDDPWSAIDCVDSTAI